MGLTDLPTETTLTIAGYLSEGEVAQLLPVSKNIYAQLSNRLLERYARRGSMRALLWATGKGKQSVAQELVQHGADINGWFKLTGQRADQGYLTLLHLAALTKRHSMVVMLLELGADPSLFDARGRTAIHLAYKSGDEQTVRLILTKITNPCQFLSDRYNRLTPLHAACYWACLL